MSYSVSQIARLAGVSVRTLHHYDQIGLLMPADRSGAGYRRYGDRDLRRLQQIMFYRELGFALSDITDLVSDPDAEPAEHLRRQHALLAARLERTRRLIEAVERAMEAEQLGTSLTPEERLEVFGAFDPAQYADEVTRRWGETDAYRQARQRTKSFSKQDWHAIRAEAAQLTAAFVAAQAAGQAADSAAVAEIAERHRQHISRWFYDCPAQIHGGLGETRTTDSPPAMRRRRQDWLVISATLSWPTRLARSSKQPGSGRRGLRTAGRFRAWNTHRARRIPI